MAENKRSLFTWLQDNARILLSIALVLFLLFAVYSYSKRGETSTAVPEEASSEEMSSENTDDVTEVSLGDAADTIGAQVDDAVNATSNTDDAQNTTNDVPTEKGPTVDYQNDVVSVSAMRGEGLTHLARRATAEYIARNNIEGITAAEKVYIEDHVRKSISKQSVRPGSTVTFTHDAITTGIERAQALNDYQKQNLAKYAVHAAL